MNNLITNLEQQLRYKMGNFEPKDIIFDDQTHTYNAYINGEYKPATYRASLYPFEKDPNGPAVICNFGLINEKEHYTYSSSENLK